MGEEEYVQNFGWKEADIKMDLRETGWGGTNWTDLP
jgi:hypothetical protein